MKFINKTRFFSLFSFFILTFTLVIAYAETAGQDIADSVLRLHIIANSDSDFDQNLKLKVRDRILKETENLFKTAKSAQEAEITARKNSELICQIARDEITSQGFDYPVAVELGEEAFPTKVYGGIALPCGKYTAVRVKIGEANGKNWWCVMYPPLCFTDGILAASDDTTVKLKASLSEEEYRLITTAQSGSVPVKIRFKIVEIFQNLF